MQGGGTGHRPWLEGPEWKQPPMVPSFTRTNKFAPTQVMTKDSLKFRACFQRGKYTYCLVFLETSRGASRDDGGAVAPGMGPTRSMSPPPPPCRQQETRGPGAPARPPTYLERLPENELCREERLE